VVLVGIGVKVAAATGVGGRVEVGGRVVSLGMTATSVPGEVGGAVVAVGIACGSRQPTASIKIKAIQKIDLCFILFHHLLSIYQVSVLYRLKKCCHYSGNDFKLVA
jgi:hypothetical protein